MPATDAAFYWTIVTAQNPFAFRLLVMLALAYTFTQVDLVEGPPLEHVPEEDPAILHRHRLHYPS